jgi:hypothetical protein
MAKGFLDDLLKFPIDGKELDNGIEPAGSNVAPNFYFADEIKNIHKSQNDGFSPRYGMSPLPVHSIA